MNVTKQYFRYVSQNIFGLIGTSCYILADTYFIAQAAGTDGVAMLNLCLPIYNFIFAFGFKMSFAVILFFAVHTIAHGTLRSAASRSVWWI